MKKTILALIISVGLFGGSVNAWDGETKYAKILNDIGMADLRWRNPNIEFVFRNDLLLAISKIDQTIIWKAGAVGNTRSGVLWYAQDKFVRQRTFNPWSYYLIPILPTILKVSIDFTGFPIGFKILNPDNGLIEERWDGSTWLRPNQLSTLDFSPGSAGTTK